MVGLALAGTGGVAGLAPGPAHADAASSSRLLAVTVEVDRASVTAPRPGSATASPLLTYAIELRSSPTEHDPLIPGVEVVDELPEGVTPVSQDSSSPVTIEGRSVRWSVGDLGFFVWRATLVVSVDATASARALPNRVVAVATDGGRAESAVVDTAVTPEAAPEVAPEQPPATSKVLAGDITRDVPASVPAPFPRATLASSPPAPRAQPELPATGAGLLPPLVIALGALAAGAALCKWGNGLFQLDQ